MNKACNHEHIEQLHVMQQQFVQRVQEYEAAIRVLMNEARYLEIRKTVEEGKATFHFYKSQGL